MLCKVSWGLMVVSSGPLQSRFWDTIKSSSDRLEQMKPEKRRDGGIGQWLPGSNGEFWSKVCITQVCTVLLCSGLSRRLRWWLQLDSWHRSKDTEAQRSLNTPLPCALCSQFFVLGNLNSDLLPQAARMVLGLVHWGPPLQDCWFSLHTLLVILAHQS